MRSMDQPEVESLAYADAVERIAWLNDGLRAFWGSAQGWAPAVAAALLSQSRLDRQVELSRCLAIWDDFPSNQRDGRLVLAWSNLGSLVEGSLKFHLAVFCADYSRTGDAPRDKWKKLIPPDTLKFEQLRQFFARNSLLPDAWLDWVSLVQQRRNAIHSFRHRELGTPDEFQLAVRKYLGLLREINSVLPYPPDHAPPAEEPLARSRTRG